MAWLLLLGHTTPRPTNVDGIHCLLEMANQITKFTTNLAGSELTSEKICTFLHLERDWILVNCSILSLGGYYAQIEFFSIHKNAVHEADNSCTTTENGGRLMLKVLGHLGNAKWQRCLKQYHLHREKKVCS